MPFRTLFNGANYTYTKNLQGDVVGILDSTGNLVVEYKYDAWGAPISIYSTSTIVDTLAFDNPFRYRGYVWDEETELYYLKSRYYAQKYCRFINSDNLLCQKRHASKHNQYTYCNNNPINFCDCNGKSYFAVALLLGAITFMLTGCSTIESSTSGYENANCYGYALGVNEYLLVGKKGGKVVEEPYTKDQIIDAVLEDNKDRMIRPLNSISDPISNNEYRIALRVGFQETQNPFNWDEKKTTYDYHFMKENENGIWSHKPAGHSVEYLSEGETPDDVLWNLYNEIGDPYLFDFYKGPTVYFAIEYE